MTSDTLYNIWRYAEFDYASPEEKRAQVDAYNSLAWYLKTGRACYAWEKALAKASPKKLMRHILKQADQSVDSQIASATAYLRRYCQYPY